MTNASAPMRTPPPAPRTYTAPPPIAKGEVLAIAAPAGPVAMERLARGLPHLQDFRVRMRGDLDRRTGYTAGDDQLRLDELNGFLRDPDVRAIMLARGGYGIMRLLPQLDRAAFLADPKALIGFSDGTALAAWALSNGYQAIHGPVATQLDDLPPEDVARLVAIMRGAPAAPLAVHGASGSASGVVVGGNLTLVASLMGTPWQVPTAHSILVLEDVGEEPYRIDRMLTQLAIGGALQDAAAVVSGDFTRCGPKSDLEDAGPTYALLAHELALRARACANGLPIGHGGRNAALWLGAPAELDATKGQLAFVTG